MAEQFFLGKGQPIPSTPYLERLRHYIEDNLTTMPPEHRACVLCGGVPFFTGAGMVDGARIGYYLCEACCTPAYVEQITARVRRDQFLQRRAPDPSPGAFRDSLERTDISCCATHRAQKRAMLASLERPAELCLLCGNLGVWRQGWGMPEAMYVPRGCTSSYLPTAYYDLCESCMQAPDARARADATLRWRYWAALN